MKKINRIVIIGNGFDLTHDLKTSFFDFINYYIKEMLNNIYKVFRLKVNNSDSNRLSDMEKFINDCQDIISNSDQEIEYLSELRGIKNEIKKFCDEYQNDPRDPDEIYKDYFHAEDWILLAKLLHHKNKDQTIPRNLFTNRFFESTLENSRKSNWGGIEHDFYNALLSILRKSGQHGTKELEELNLNFENIIVCLKSYLSDHSLAHEVKIKATFSTYLDSGIDINEISDKNLKKIINQNAIDARNTELNSNDIHVNKTLFLNFNYTETIQKYIDKDHDNPPKNIQIHGELNNPNNPIIFGYGDEIDNSYQELQNKNDNNYLKYIKSMHYLSTPNYKKLLDFLESDYYQIYIWGHSCAVSDRVLLNTLFEHKNCVSIKPFYHQKKDGSDNYTDLITNISRSFNDKKLFRSLVVNKENCTTL